MADSKVRLDKPQDWPAWSRAAKAFSVNSGLWEYMDPKGKERFPRKPPKPIFEDFQMAPKPAKTTTAERQAARAETRAAAAGTTTSERPRTRATAAVAGQPPQTPERETQETATIEGNISDNLSTPPASPRYSDLTAAGRLDFDRAEKVYTMAVAEVKDLTKYRVQFDTWFSETVAERYKKMVENETDLRTVWVTLEKQYAPYKMEKAREVRAKYKAHMGMKPGEVSKQLAAWVTAWKALIDEGLNEGLVELTDPTVWYNDLMDLLKQVDGASAYANGMLATLEDDIYAEKMDHNELAAKMEKQFARQTIPTRYKMSAFPTFHGQDVDNNAGESSRGPSRGRGGAPRSGYQGKRDRSNTTRTQEQDPKRARASEVVCEACAQRHPTAKCWYTWPPEETPDWFTPEEERYKRVRKRLREDPILRKKVAEAAAARSKEQR